MGWKSARSLALLVIASGAMGVGAGCSGTIDSAQGGGAAAGGGHPGSGGTGSGGSGGGTGGSGGGPITPTMLALLIDQPPRGALIPQASGDAVPVSGKVLGHQNEELLIDGQAVPVGGDGTFQTSVPATVGLNVITAQVGGGAGPRGARAFLYGDFAPAGAAVPRAVEVRVNRTGLDGAPAPGYDLSQLAEAALADRNLMAAIPSNWGLSAPVVGHVDVELTSKRADRASVHLTPDSGGISARVSLPNVAIDWRLSFGCLFTTCHVTGNVTARAVNVTDPVRLSLQGQAIDAHSGSVTVELVGFDYNIDGALGSLAEAAVNTFVPDLQNRLESALAGLISSALPQDLSFALSQIALPSRIDLHPVLEGSVDVSQQFDTVSFGTDGGTIGAAVQLSASFDPGSPGALAPGWLRQGGQANTFRTDPSFAVSVAVDSLNELLFTVWGLGALKDRPITDSPQELGGYQFGPITATFLPPPIVTVDGAGTATLGLGDVLINTTLEGNAIQVALSLTWNAQLTLDAPDNSVHFDMVGDPTVHAELISGQTPLPGPVFDMLIEQMAPQMGSLVSGVRLPLPVIPLDGVASSLSGQTLHLVDPSSVVLGDPPERLTLYGNFALQ